MTTRVKLMIVGLASGLAVALVALAFVALQRPARGTPSGTGPSVASAADAGENGTEAPADSPAASGDSGKSTDHNTTGSGGNSDPTTTTTTTQPPGGGGSGGGGGGGKPPRPPITIVLDPPVVIDPGSPTTTTVPLEPHFPCKVIKLCQDLPF